MMSNRNEFSAVWQVICPDGSVYVAPDSFPGSNGHIYSRSTADSVAGEVCGTVRQVMNAEARGRA